MLVYFLDPTPIPYFVIILNCAFISETYQSFLYFRAFMFSIHSASNTLHFLTKRQNKIPEFFLTLSLSIMIVLDLVGGWLVAESLTVMSQIY